MLGQAEILVGKINPPDEASTHQGSDRFCVKCSDDGNGQLTDDKPFSRCSRIEGRDGLVTMRIDGGKGKSRYENESASPDKACN